MKRALYLLLISTFIGFGGCEKDPCDSTLCLNGGVCNDGTCLCPEGYSGEQCEIQDPCSNINCLNGGTCVNGLCDCPDGYQGANCGLQVTPSAMTITKIIVTKFPATDNGAGWDLTSGPDIYLVIERGALTVYNNPTGFENANPSISYEFVPSPSIAISQPNVEHAIALFDYDSSSTDDFMGGILFTPYFSNTNGFPNILYLEIGDIGFRLHVTYIW